MDVAAKAPSAVQRPFWARYGFPKAPAAVSATPAEPTAPALRSRRRENPSTPSVSGDVASSCFDSPRGRIVQLLEHRQAPF